MSLDVISFSLRQYPRQFSSQPLYSTSISVCQPNAVRDYSSPPLTSFLLLPHDRSLSFFRLLELRAGLCILLLLQSRNVSLLRSNKGPRDKRMRQRGG
jgi:hypothetical protein